MLIMAMADAAEMAQMAETAEMEGTVPPVEEAMEAMEVTANMAEGEMVVMVATVLPEVGVVDQEEWDLRETGVMEEMDVRDNWESTI